MTYETYHNAVRIAKLHLAAVTVCTREALIDELLDQAVGVDTVDQASAVVGKMVSDGVIALVTDSATIDAIEYALPA